MRAIDADALMKDVRENSESYFADDFAEFWVNRQPTIQLEPHWIPVTERLPEIETDVLFTAWDGKRYFVGWVDAFGKWYGDDEEVNEGYEPIAWCALPEPYKGVTT